MTRRARTLEEQVLKPIEDPNEMGLPVAEAASRVGLTADDVAIPIQALTLN